MISSFENLPSTLFMLVTESSLNNEFFYGLLVRIIYSFRSIGIDIEFVMRN